MTDCPTRNQLQLMLEAGLEGAEQSAIESHVDSCPACQQALEQLTAGPPRAEPSQTDPNATTFLARLQAMSPSVDIGPWPKARPDPTIKLAPPPDIPGYDIEGQLGHGGMGVVYLARHRRLNRLVALKMLTEGGLRDVSVRNRFFVEAESIAQLRHPHIVQVYEFGEQKGRPYFAMEYADGGNLAEWLANKRHFTPREAASFIAKIADGLAAAHAKGIIHRDLKPSNILLTTAENSTNLDVKVPKVADFGIARVSQSHLTSTGEVLGTPSYMAPEQAGGRTREVGTATDVYGLGAILYELLAGQPPFLCEAVIDTLQQVATMPPRPPRSIVRTVPRDLDTICLKCLEKDPKKRYPTADSLAAELRAYLDGRTILARPTRPWERAVRVASRNPVPAVAAFLVLATVIAAFIWVSEAWHHETVARKGEESTRLRSQDSEKDAISARKLAERTATRTAFDRAYSLCDSGNVVRGLAEFATVLESAKQADDADLAVIVRRNIAAWEPHRPRELQRFDAADLTRPVTVTALADNNKLLVTGSRRGGPVRVWPFIGNLPDGKAVWDLPAPDEKRSGVIGLFPLPDSKLLAVYESGHISEWDLQTGLPIGHDLALDLPSPIRSACATLPPRVTSGKLLCVGYEDGTFRLWDLDKKSFLVSEDESPIQRHFFLGLKKRQKGYDHPNYEPNMLLGAVAAIDFCDNGNMLLTAGEKEGVILLGLRIPKNGYLHELVVNGKPNPRVAYHQFDLGGPVFELLVDPSRQLFLAGGATAVSLWTIHDRERPRWVHSHPDRITALSFSNDGKLCASADRGGTIRCWHVLTGELRAQLHFTEPILSLRFSPTGPNALLVGSQNGTSGLWQLPVQSEIASRPVEATPAGPGVVIRIGTNPEQAVFATGFEPLRRGEWTATRDRVVFWSGDGSPIRLILPKDNETLLSDCVAVKSDGTVAVVKFAGRSAISVCDLRNQRIPAQQVHAEGVARLGFLSETLFFTVSDEPDPSTKRPATLFSVWELGTPEAASRRASWHLGNATCVAPHPDGKRVLVCRLGDDRVTFLDAASGREVGPTFRHARVTAAAIDLGGQWAATAGIDQSVRLWALGDGEKGKHAERSPFHSDRVNAMAFGTGASVGVLVTASSDGTARFWDARSGYPLGPPLRHPGAVLSVAFDAAGERVITGGRTGDAKIWPVPKAAP